MRYQDENGDYVAATAEGIEICVGSTAYVISLGGWHKLAIDAENQRDQQGSLQSYGTTQQEPSKADEISRYLYMLYEAQKCGHAVHEEIGEGLIALKAALGV